MDSRQKFEEWARKMSVDLEYRNIPGVGQFYECPRTLLALEAWQASRATIVLDMPRSFSEDRYFREVYDVEDVHDVIHAAGIRTK